MKSPYSVTGGEVRTVTKGLAGFDQVPPAPHPARATERKRRTPVGADSTARDPTAAHLLCGPRCTVCFPS